MAKTNLTTLERNFVSAFSKIFLHVAGFAAMLLLCGITRLLRLDNGQSGILLAATVLAAVFGLALPRLAETVKQ